ncbi:MAG TPA: hypothetical protein VM582_08125 [Candidatus Thermoplasmatota archaeon]|nr:hypothetical protein [Candidatus Thermoplasmatota archaeon]
MMIRTPAKDMTERREIKVSLPVALHLRLHALKIHHGILIADVLTAALEEYFANAKRAREAEAVKGA